MKVPLYNQQAEVIGDIELNPKIFEVKQSLHLMAESVRVQQSNSRKGLAHTKTRADVSGGGKKPWKQKGTGRARAGSTRSPLWRHGGVTFGPRSNRNWELKLNKKAKSKALFMSLSDKASSGHIMVVDAITLPEAKTKAFAAMLKGFAKDQKKPKFLFVVPGVEKVLSKSSRNIPSVSPVLATSLNIVDILKADTVLVMKDSLPVIEKTYLKTVKAKA
jgi:large subunit ribosomal protein L4